MRVRYLKLMFINRSKTGKRKAYENEFGNIYLDCSECNEPKPIDSYNNSPKGFYKKHSKCYDCRRKKYFRHEEQLGNVVTLGEVKLAVIDVTVRGRRKLTDDYGNEYLDCTSCGKILPFNNFVERDIKFGRQSRCIACDHLIAKEWREKNPERHYESVKKWNIDNRERLNKLSRVNYLKNREHIRKLQCGYREKDRERYREHSRKWVRNNPEYQVHLTRLRRARIRKLPYDLSTKQRDQLLANGCCLTGATENIHLDHIIPLNVGHGGTTYKNMVAIRGDLNNSKVDHNIFEWAKARYEQFGFTLEHFNNVMSEIAERNEMSIEEYREYVYWCHNNPTDIKECLTHYELNRKGFFERLEIGLEMYIQGETYKAIKNATNIGSNTILKYLREREIPTRMTDSQS